MKPTILFLFNTSDYAVRPWIDDGRFNVVSVDYDDTDHSGAHRSPCEGHTVFNIDLSHYNAAMVVKDTLYCNDMAQPSLVISFAPCTDLAVSGARHFKAKAEKDPQFQDKAVEMAKLASYFGCPYMVENPVSRLASLWKKPAMYWHPWEFTGYIRGDEGPHPEFPEVIPEFDMYNKKTGLWCSDNFRLPKKRRWAGPPVEQDNPGWKKLGGKSARTKYIRSLTPRGFARAVYEANKEFVAQ